MSILFSVGQGRQLDHQWLGGLLSGDLLVLVLLRGRLERPLLEEVGHHVPEDEVEGEDENEERSGVGALEVDLE